MDGAPTYFYRERLRVPTVWWFLGLLAAGTTWVTVVVAGGPVFAAAVTLVTAVFVAMSLAAYGRAEVAVSTEGFRAGSALLPLWAVGTVTSLDAERTRDLAGPGADSRAFLELRGYVRTAVRVQVVDEIDPTPYWLVSTRHPQRCAQALQAAKAGRNA
jgi:hypothetical protein